MTTGLFTHPDCLDHASPAGHPECVERLSVVLAALDDFDLKKFEAKDATYDQVRLVHGQDHIDKIKDNIPEDGNAYIDGDTYLSSGSEKAALKATGAVCQAIDAVMAGDVDNAFCAVRPPGHHAEPDIAMGFCLYNAAAIGALYARNTHFCHRVAIIDFDVHHGNGTQTVAENTSRLFYGSTHQSPLYPGTGHLHDFGKGIIVNAPLAAGSGGKAFRHAYENRVLPELDEFKPDLVIISAGFDAHMMDPLADINLDEDDYYWVTNEIMKIADKQAKGRVVSTLEGGYNLAILGECVKKHVSALMGQ